MNQCLLRSQQGCSGVGGGGLCPELRHTTVRVHQQHAPQHAIAGVHAPCQGFALASGA